MLNKTDARPEQTPLHRVLTRLAGEAGLIDAQFSQAVDRRLRAAIAGATRGMSPLAIVNAYVDWLGHLALSPAKLLSLVESLARKSVALGVYGARSLLDPDEPDIATLPDRRMQGEHWQRWPFKVFAQGYALARAVADELTADVHGVDERNRELVAFLTGQVLELLSPANIPLTNPEVVATTVREHGANLKRGAAHLRDDLARRDDATPAAAGQDYRVGKNIAITPGKIVYRNELIELIQYGPSTAEVLSEPVLIVPAWIMKYYILDLSPDNSLVRFLRDQGKTVFAISWKNPTALDRDLGMNDYLRRGVMASIDAVTAITGAPRIHAVGYCLGGTLMSIAAAYMAREHDERLKSLSIFAAQVDFTEAGEITKFLGPSTLSFLEPMMARQGYLGIQHMTGAFRSLRASQQIYAPAVDRYLLGKEARLNDLMTWNVDGTRMPHRMHSEYLRRCYLNNDLAEARYEVGGRPICLGDIRVPMFLLGTLTDHVAPWQSVYKALRLVHGELTFALTSAGHNAGIVCGPLHPRRRYQIDQRPAGALYTDPDTWQAQTPVRDGSWWPAWDQWLDSHASGTTRPPPMGAPGKGYPPAGDAPGEYVFG